MTFPDDREAIERSSFFNEKWYYSIELIPGLFTQGANHRNLGLTRDLLKRCEVKDRRCLDIGTMEGAVPILLSRRGAGPIVAWTSVMLVRGVTLRPSERSRTARSPWYQVSSN